MYKKNDRDIDEIRKWIWDQKFLPKDLSEDFIHTFLWGCQGDKNMAKGVLANYFYVRQSVPEIFTNRDPLTKEFIEAWKGSCFGPLERLPDNTMVFLGSIIDTNNYHFAKFARQVFMCYDLMIKNKEWGNGDRIMILGYKDMTIKNLAGFTVYLTRKVAECERERYLPGKLKAVHLVNLPSFMETIHQLFKPFLNPEDLKAVHFHRSITTLHKFVSPSILPDEYDGTAGPLKDFADKWYEKLVRHREFFLTEELKRAEECRSQIASKHRQTVPNIMYRNRRSMKGFQS